jgi:predicted transcriptional regulator
MPADADIRFDLQALVLHLCHMADTATTTIRLNPAAKRRVNAAARRHGVSTHKFIVDAALARAEAPTNDDRLAQLAALINQLKGAVEDEIDFRIADAAWKRHLKEKTRLYTPEEAKRELGL